MSNLTEREKEILRFVDLGLSNKEIGDRLGTAEQTVKNQLRSVNIKLGTRKRMLAFSAAMTKRIL